MRWQIMLELALVQLEGQGEHPEIREEATHLPRPDLQRYRPDPCNSADERDLVADLLPVTVPEVRRLLWRLVWDRVPEPAAVLRWSDWRRRHQQRARRAHWYRRTHHHEPRL